MEGEEMKCTYCGKKAVWCENKEIYGKNYGKSYMVYYCKPCDAYVGCHNNTKEPLGTMANRETREARMRVHHLIDRFWKTGGYSRGFIYKVISYHTGKQFHTGDCDIAECEKILALPLETLLKQNSKEPINAVLENGKGEDVI
jgi:hypothetical protein